MEYELFIIYLFYYKRKRDAPQVEVWYPVVVDLRGERKVRISF